MQVTVNGQAFEATPGMTIAQLLRAAEIPENYLAVEINADVIPRELHATQEIAPGDLIEVVTLVGGG